MSSAESVSVALTIHQRFAEQLARTPDAVAVAAGETRLTYRELDDRASRLAGRLHELGVTWEDRVSVLMERSADLIVALLGILKAGACYLPLHSAYPIERMRRIVETAGASVLLADRSTQAKGVPEHQHVVLVDEPVEAEPMTVEAHPDGLAYVIFTSGSTGQPKGVAVTHRNVLALIGDPVLAGGAHERVPMLAPYAFDVSTFEVWVPLLHGGCVVVPPPGDLDVATIERVITGCGATAVHLTAGLFRVVADEAPHCLADVREVLTGGDVVSPQAVARVLAACPDLTVHAMYGPTESTLFATRATITAPYTPAATVPIGRPLDRVTARVLDADLHPVEPGATGELYLAGEQLARGYLGRPDLTEERFVDDPFDGGRMYRTGDLARWTDDGQLDFAGRVDDQVKIRGYRVEPAEIAAVAATHDGVHDVAVVARTDEAGNRLVAYVVGPDVDTGALRTHLVAALPDYMVPAAVITLDALPLTANGKLDRDRLPEPPAEGTAYRAPRDEIERALCEVFAEVLGVPRVGIDDDFFELGGQSLLAMRLIRRTRAVLGVEPSITAVFDSPTPLDLAAELRETEQLAS
ncbi:non-ribosomal peptide synthetase [Actinophytocola gossypii]|uniref:Non-ribosomal peptide synthetase n=1 Tax=Actinophytocola gossypii TaxID=2812003 RepID=A0ABT2JG24_9PSEU|nr:non-ribosomal peptide synthetase [Actinophytocola gossypii]MCT2586817.1 non-ribosomal peptide synthetase [Actinophytocola gossypii]